MKLPTRNCGNCRFWSDQGKYTHCRRGPPKAFNEGLDQDGQLMREYSAYPIVPWWSRCGEYRMRISKLFKKYNPIHVATEGQQ